MKIYVVGIGPGGSEYMTPQAACAIENSEIGRASCRERVYATV